MSLRAAEATTVLAAAIHDGDPYTQGLAQAFADAFEAEGGTITGFSAVNKDDTDMVPALTEIAAGGPGALFFPIFQPAGDFIAGQAPGVPGLEDTVLLTADSLLNSNYLTLPQTTGMYFSGPDQRHEGNVNQSTGKSTGDFLAAYVQSYGESRSRCYHAGRALAEKLGPWGGRSSCATISSPSSSNAASAVLIAVP